MKLNTVERNIESSGMGASVGFRIDMNKKAFNVLSDNMYSHIIPTMIRELSSNAYDSHVEAGYPEKPFNISVPNSFDPYFMVEDFGTGLRYYRYDCTVTNEHEGESNVIIDGDVRSDVKGIDVFSLDEEYVSMIGLPLYDTTDDKTIIRVLGDYSGDKVVEFDDALVLTITFFRSTKEDTNDQIGAWGLGFKTPQAYTDNYFLINRYDGTERTYNIYKDAEGLPMIRVITTVPTTECNGVKIKIGVAPEDFDSFKEGIVEQLRYFNPAPVLMNDMVAFPTLIYDGYDYALYENNEYAGYNTANGMVGNNAYSVKGIGSEVFSDGNLVLKFKIGELMVTASREELRYDDATYELIRKREQEAIEEYRDYLLDSIDLTDKTTHEKADWMNRNHRQVIELNSDEVVEMVADPHFQYGKHQIRIPLHTWGSFHSVDFYDHADVDGKISTQMRKGYLNKAPVFKVYNGKTNKLENSSQYVHVEPNADVTIFLKDTNFSFLKKIAYYISENGQSSNTYVLAAEADDDIVSYLKDILGSHVTFISISDVKIPKNISFKPTSHNPTPIARMFNVERPMNVTWPKYWNDMYTPLTKIDTDAYVVCTHRNEIEGVGHYDMEFLKAWLSSNGSEFDPDTVILAMSRARYAKAIGYGFTPLQELIDEIKATVKYPQWVSDYDKLEEGYDRINQTGVYDTFSDFELKDLISEFGKDHPITKIRRLRTIWKNRYKVKSDQVRAFNALSQWIDADLTQPEPSDSSTKVVDFTKELCKNVSDTLVLLDGTSSWHYNDPKKRQALIDYTKFVFNTQESTNE